MGWWPDVGVFAGFDYNMHTGVLGASPSMQIKEVNLRNALINGFSAYDRGNNEIAIAFRPDFFVEYVRSLESLHSLGESEHDVGIVAQVVAGDLAVNSQEIQELTEDRQTVIETIARKLRDNSFKRRVLSSYGNQCAFSGMQLRLIDAAHILPVSVPHSTDDTSNGIALSPLYHRAYDRGLVTFNEEYQIIINEHKINKLREIGFDGGLEQFRAHLRPIIIIPPANHDRPNTRFIEEANRLRVGTKQSDVAQFQKVFEAGCLLIFLWCQN